MKRLKLATSVVLTIFFALLMTCIIVYAVNKPEFYSSLELRQIISALLFGLGVLWALTTASIHVIPDDKGE